MLGRPRIYSDKQRRIRKIHHNIWYRCNYPLTNGYDRYGGAGIRCDITLPELEQLWDRDKAFQMEQPSIDRINPAKHYTFDNCRFLEFRENSKLKRTKACSYCKSQFIFFRNTRSDLCRDCRKLKVCEQCGTKFSKSHARRGFTFCNKCNVKRCGRCRKVKSITEFGRNRRLSDFLNKDCKKCNSERANAWYHANRA